MRTTWSSRNSVSAICPDPEGIETEDHVVLTEFDLSAICPDPEGIETAGGKINRDGVIRPRFALIQKGLRPV